VGEILAPRLTTFHNIHFFLWLMAEIREAILKERFLEWEKVFLEKYRQTTDH